MTGMPTRRPADSGIVGARRREVGVYRRRRAAVAAVATAAFSVLGLGAHGVLTGPGGVPASAAGAGTAPRLARVRAEEGDSLWSIAVRYHGDVGLSRYVDELVDLNGGTRIEAGQMVRLP